MTRWVAAAPGLIVAVAAASGGERVLRPDLARSEVSFTLGATLHTVHGSMDLARAEVRVDPDTGAVAGRVVADARSARTGNDRRDRKMHASVLESGRFPEVVLDLRGLSGPIRPEGKSRVDLRAVLTLHGDAHELVLPLEVRLAGRAVEATTAFDVPYVAWGMDDPSTFVLRVRKTVRVEATLAGVLEDAPAAGPAPE